MPTPTTPPSMTAPPPAPNRNNPSVFRVRMDAFLAWIVAWYLELVEVVTNVYDNAASAFASAAAAASSAASAAVSQTSAANSAAMSAALAGAPAWDPLKVYAVGDPAYSPVNGLVYRRHTAAGAGGADPSDTSSATRWEPAATTFLQRVNEAAAAAAVRVNTDTLFSNAGACTATAPTPTSVGQAFRVRFGNSRADNVVDFGAKSVKGANGALLTGVVTYNLLLSPTYRWWGDYWRID